MRNKVRCRIVKEFLSVSLLGIQGFVTVALFARLAERMPKMLAWGACCVVGVVLGMSIAFWQVVFRARGLVRIALRTFISALLAGAIGFSALSMSNTFLYVVGKMLCGEGGWTRHVGEAELYAGSERIVYDVYSGKVLTASLNPVDGLLLEARNEPKTAFGRAVGMLALSRECLYWAPVRRIDLPGLPSPTLCYGILPLDDRLKVDAVKQIAVEVLDGKRRFKCKLTKRYGGGEFVLTIDDRLFQL